MQKAQTCPPPQFPVPILPALYQRHLPPFLPQQQQSILAQNPGHKYADVRIQDNHSCSFTTILDSFFDFPVLATLVYLLSITPAE